MVTTTDTKCAACSKGGDGLKKCGACKLVKYCGAACQRAHRPHHKKECKKRAAELHDEALFRQPPSREDCPICFLELPFALASTYKTCCGKILCNGCEFAHAQQADGCPSCPFCRKPRPSTDEEDMKRVERRVGLNDPKAMELMGNNYMMGEMGLQEDIDKALELLQNAVELGSTGAHYNLGCLYYHGKNGVEEDKEKTKYYWEIAAMGGHVQARHNLGAVENREGNHHRAMKHLAISARMGDDGSLKGVEFGYMNGLITKDEFEKILRAHRKSQDELKSEWRDKAAAANPSPISML